MLLVGADSTFSHRYTVRLTRSFDNFLPTSHKVFEIMVTNMTVRHTLLALPLTFREPQSSISNWSLTPMSCHFDLVLAHSETFYAVRRDNVACVSDNSLRHDRMHLAVVLTCSSSETHLSNLSVVGSGCNYFLTKANSGA